MKTMVSRWIGIAIGLAGLSGCAERESGPVGDEPAEEVAEVQQAWGESSCTTASVSATENNVELDAAEYSALHISSSGTYGNANCTDTYLVEYIAEDDADDNLVTQGD